MNLSLAELTRLPAPAALVQGDDVLAQTPEWRGKGPGTVSYPLRNGRLLVATSDASPESLPVLDMLLDELDRLSARLAAPQSLRVAMLAASLGLLGGRVLPAVGTGRDVVKHAAAGIGARTALQLTVRGDATAEVPAPAVLALVLVQLAANAERHDGASAIELLVEGSLFTLRWRCSLPQAAPAPAAAPPTATSRRRDDRARWGLGFARLAADATGARLFGAIADPTGDMSAVLEVGTPRLALPLCMVRGGRVVKATRSWDEESGVAPPSPVAPQGRLAQCLAAAAASPSATVAVDGWCARQCGDETWVAVPPDGLRKRAADVLDGMVHERALWDHVGEPARVRIVALATLLAFQLGEELPRVPSLAWDRAAPPLARSLGLAWTIPACPGLGAVDPHVVVVVAAELGDGFGVDGDDLYVQLRADGAAHPLARGLPVDAGGRWRIS